MNRLLFALIALTIYCGFCKAEVPAETAAFSPPVSSTPDGVPSSTMNGTVAGNNVLVTHSNIIITSDQDKRGVVDFIKSLVMKGGSPQDDDTLTTQIITLLSPHNITTDLAAKMTQTVKRALHSRAKPAQLRQIILRVLD
ncbi:unnamed protein product [Phytophthora fragariaefolia]|uniref:Unnamed protein product n=1 Tax=Phytophthora fragariaefolia TaxID=1490495 RepID=A0A9W6Y4I5_9STRA|nr:unnamed protein product [Phytophthora fragariaefolia]